jgi:hypothetical protein
MAQAQAKAAVRFNAACVFGQNCAAIQPEPV